MSPYTGSGCHPAEHSNESPAGIGSCRELHSRGKLWACLMPWRPRTASSAPNMRSVMPPPGVSSSRMNLVYAGQCNPLAEATSTYRGYLVAEPKRHVAGLGDLTDPEAAALGRLVNRLARALKEVAEAEHVYSFVFGDGLAHAHLHVVMAPRYAGTPVQYWGVRLREWPDVGEDEMRGLVAQLRAHVIDD